jgi:hypothetical protein
MASEGSIGEGVLDFIQQVVGGIALGCVYGLIALGFVLIYKATEVVNFAQVPPSCWRTVQFRCRRSRPYWPPDFHCRVRQSHKVIHAQRAQTNR